MLQCIFENCIVLVFLPLKLTRKLLRKPNDVGLHDTKNYYNHVWLTSIIMYNSTGFVQLVSKTHAVAHVLSTYKTIQVNIMGGWRGVGWAQKTG